MRRTCHSVFLARAGLAFFVLMLCVCMLPTRIDSLSSLGNRAESLIAGRNGVLYSVSPGQLVRIDGGHVQRTNTACSKLFACHLLPNGNFLLLSDYLTELRLR